MKPNFASILDRSLDYIYKPKPKMKRSKVRAKHADTSAQAQKYALVPQWRRRPGGRKGEMK